MPLPFGLLPGLAAGKKIISGLAPSLGLAPGGSSSGKRRRRRGLTGKQKSDMMWLKNNIGKTAAANYMHAKNIG